MPAHHLVTHGVVVGMTGSGKTGLVTVTVEEALRAGVPVLAIDAKGDLPNLLLAFPSFGDAPRQGGPRGVGDRRAGPRVLLRAHGRARHHAGLDGGEPLHVLSSLERRSSRWDHDPEAARASLSAAVALVLRLDGRDPDPARSKEHVLLSLLAERRLKAGRRRRSRDAPRRPDP